MTNVSIPIHDRLRSGMLLFFLLLHLSLPEMLCVYLRECFRWLPLSLGEQSFSAACPSRSKTDVAFPPVLSSRGSRHAKILNYHTLQLAMLDRQTNSSKGCEQADGC